MQIISDRIGLLHKDMGELKDSMRDSMREVAVAVNKLVALETRQEAINQSYKQVLIQLEKEQDKREKLENRLDSLEREQPMNKQVVRWILYAVGAICVAAATFVGKAVGLM